MRSLLWVLLLGVPSSACRCSPGVTMVPPADLRVSPASITFPATFVGQRASVTVTLTNAGGAAATVTPSVAAPFLVDGAELSVGSGDEVSFTVTFSPTEEGSASSELRVGGLSVAVDGRGLSVPVCPPPGTCAETRFDFERQQCVAAQTRDGTSCETGCVVGACSSGACVGNLKGCDTGNACLIPTCSETTGCGSVPRVCPPPASPCRVATCDAVTGCGLIDVLDGTLCGTDDCLASQVDVCLAGQCVPRPRPMTARCSNRWVPTTLPSRSGAGLAWDGSRVLVFGGQSGGVAMTDTWSFDGALWELRYPITTPSALRQPMLAWDEVRRRVVLFGSTAPGAAPETWEWDGMTWLQRQPARSPPAPRSVSEPNAQMTFNASRGRVMLHHGLDGTWEWTGVTWRALSSPTLPPANRDFSLAFDGVSGRLLLFGGRSSTLAGDELDETWVFDGTWRRLTLARSPPSRLLAPMVWDPLRRRVVLHGGADRSGRRSDTWEWDGSQWLERQPPTVPDSSASLGVLTFDEARQQVLLFGGTPDVVSTWDGTNWTNLRGPSRPPSLWESALVADTRRSRVVLFGGRASTASDETWEWDGSSWLQRHPAIAPPARSGHAMAFDPQRGRVVLFGGFGATALSDTWEWDGSSWSQRFPATSPPPQNIFSMTWNPARQRVVLFGAQTNNALWEWDGTSWLEQPSAVGPPSSSLNSLAWEPLGQRLMAVSVTGGRAGSTWAWSTEWSNLAVPAPTSPRAALALEPSSQRVVMFARPTTPSVAMQTLEFDGAQWMSRNPQAPPPNLFDFSFVWDPARQRLLAVSMSDAWVLLP